MFVLARPSAHSPMSCQCDGQTEAVGGDLKVQDAFEVLDGMKQVHSGAELTPLCGEPKDDCATQKASWSFVSKPET